VFWKYEVDKAV